MKKKLHNLILTIIIMAIATFLSFIFFHFFHKNTVNIPLIYILALVITARYTSGYWYGIISSIFCVALINCFFTYPFFQFNFTLTGYPFTFLCMLIISIITSATTTHLKIQTKLLLEKEEMLQHVEKEKMRANLLRAISHDLRTPLTSIMGSSSTYLENHQTLSEEDKLEYVKRINDDSNWLIHMVENLLSVTRIEEATAQVKKSLEVIEEVVAEAVHRFKTRQPNATLKTQIPDEFILLPMDALLIEQVIINLLENAYIHSNSEEPIELTITDHPKNVSFRIRDYGIGISSSKLENIFDGTSTRTSDVADGNKGMGIGLSICKTIVEAHNGTICANNLDKGAEFIFTLPKENQNDI